MKPYHVIFFEYNKLFFHNFIRAVILWIDQTTILPSDHIITGLSAQIAQRKHDIMKAWN